MPDTYATTRTVTLHLSTLHATPDLADQAALAAVASLDRHAIVGNWSRDARGTRVWIAVTFAHENEIAGLLRDAQNAASHIASVYAEVSA